MTSACERCGLAASQRCAGCSVPFYCGRGCQRADWPHHKQRCRSTEVRRDAGDVRGRYTVATRPLAAGQLLWREPSVAVGPQLHAAPQCLGCGRQLVAQRSAPCPDGCGWPVCAGGGACQRTEHSADECAVLARNTTDARPDPTNPVSSAQYDCILPLRVLLLKRHQPRVWQRLMELESHLDKRRDTAIYRDNQQHVVDYLLQRCHLVEERTDNGEPLVDEQLMHIICGVLDVNAFALRVTHGFGRRRVLFSRTSLLNHDCVSNTHLSLDGATMLVRVAADIAPGASVTAAYIGAFEPTLRRLDYLLQGKYFSCSCQRCSDPTELGTHFGSHRCLECAAMVVSTQPLDTEAVWKCGGCDRQQTAAQVRQLNDQLAAELDSYSDSTQQVEELNSFLQRHAKLLHPTNQHTLSARQKLAQLYGNQPDYQLETLSDNQLRQKAAHCSAVIAASRLFEPGVSRLRAALLVEMHHALVSWAQRQQAAGRISSDQLLERLHEGGQCLEQAVAMLDYEPESTPEGGALLHTARETLQGCYEFIQLVQSSVTRCDKKHARHHRRHQCANGHKSA